MSPARGPPADWGELGRHLVIYNHTEKGRSLLNIALSTDGKVHVTYTWKRKKVAHAVIDPSQLHAKGKS